MPIFPSSQATSQRDSEFHPVDESFITWSYDLGLMTAAATAISAGRAYMCRMFVPVSRPITNVCVWVSTAGATVANGRLGVFDSSGTRLQETAAITTAFQTTGFKEIPLATVVAATPGYYWAGLVVGSAGTVPQFRRSNNGTAAEINVKVGDASATTRAAWLTTTGLTDLPTSFTPGTAFAATPPALFWMGFT